MNDAWYMLFSVCAVVALVFVFTNPAISGMGYISHMEYGTQGDHLAAPLPWYHGDPCDMKRNGEIYSNGQLIVPAPGRYCHNNKLVDVECIKGTLNLLTIDVC